MYEPILYAIIGAFVVWEAIAHFVWHNGPDGSTLSSLIGHLEANKTFGWIVRIAVAAAVILLGVHLELFP